MFVNPKVSQALIVFLATQRRTSGSQTPYYLHFRIFTAFAAIYILNLTSVTMPNIRALPFSKSLHGTMIGLHTGFSGLRITISP